MLLKNIIRGRKTLSTPISSSKFDEHINTVPQGAILLTMLSNLCTYKLLTCRISFRVNNFNVINLPRIHLQTEITIIIVTFISVNSEANARRIALVENCFGSSGQVIIK